MKRPTSLRLRLLLATLAVTLVSWTVVAVTGYLDTKQELDALLDAHLAQSASLLTAQLEVEDDDGEIELEHAPPIHRYERRLIYQVWDRDGRLRLRSAAAPEQRLTTLQGFSDAVAGSQHYRVYSAWSRDRTALVQVGERMNSRWLVRDEILEHLLIPLLTALPLLAGFLLVAIHRALRPLSALATAVAHRQPDSLDPLPVAGAPREVLPLVEQLNGLFRRMHLSLDNERRFTADASHELRTPIAGIRAQAQVALGAIETEERHTALARVIAGCDRVTHLIGQLLTLARLESGKAETCAVTCDLAELAREVLAESAEQAHGKRIGLQLEGSAARLSGNPELLRVLLRNLVDNAIRYSPPHTTVALTTGIAQEGAWLEVNDQGPGVPPSQRQRVLDRFYRVVGSGESGSGLGLSIVSRIAEMHGAALELGDGPEGRGFRVRLQFAG